ncbi:hypothetical protein [Corynebacterium aquatimens]|uniref:Uncharacterized protein n=1 Tax=Corynebacterium aquatimens TaxID=1190508 RepID=A0A931E1P2_9CORY|nr:hypothetical protein [Corynebacterium aquatimens]MBG6122020.1 hypothetical protein [Corynebacterium aquatimens]WJY65441.1 hypothetical protein CAQUA_03640 [Corynebacterium aquatimens]
MSTQEEKKKTVIQRLPLPAFLLLYAVAIILGVLLVANLVNYNDGPARTTVVTQTTYVYPPPTPVKNQANVNKVIRPDLIANSHTATTETGVVVTGTLTEAAMANIPELSRHTSDLLQHDCIDSMTLTAPDNMRLSFTGYCFSSNDPRSTQRLIEFALTNGADSVEFSNFPSRFFKTHASIRWFADSDTTAKNLLNTSNSLRRPPDIEAIKLYAFTPDTLHQVTKMKGRPDHHSVGPISTPGDGNKSR